MHAPLLTEGAYSVNGCILIPNSGVTSCGVCEVIYNTALPSDGFAQLQWRPLSTIEAALSIYQNQRFSSLLFLQTVALTGVVRKEILPLRSM